VKLTIAVDVHYVADERAVAAGIAFSDWRSDRIERTETAEIRHVLPYRPGDFYERELPCLLAVLERFQSVIGTVIVDGYVTIGADQADGLGAHLYRALGGAVPVIGVAKNHFAGTPEESEVYRGKSARPLFVTSRGIALEDTKRLIRDMHGDHRLPTLLAAVDRACRKALAGQR